MRTRRRKRTRCSRGFCAAALLGTALLLGAALPARVQAQPLCFPLDTEQQVSDAYGWRTDPFTEKETFHNGIDLACPEGTAVLAAADGTVTRAEHSDSYGNCLRLLHPDGSETVYAHLQDLFVRAGEAVCAGQVLGTAGRTGRATGPHLHFELWRNGQACDPAAALGLDQ